MKEAVAKLRFCRFWGSFEPISSFFSGGNIRTLILPPEKKEEIGQNNPQNRRTLSFAAASKRIWNRFFHRREVSRLPPYQGKIEVFSRHCILSTISQHKKRLSGFSHKRCFDNLMKTIDLEKANITFFLDTARGDRAGHFLPEDRTIEIKEGTETGSFLHILDHVLSLPLDPETIIYFVEDDYIHREGWVNVLLEGFEIPGVEYVTLYDHRDKYFFPMYDDLKVKLFATKSCHWRTTPSTTQTFAVRLKTLKRDEAIHRKYSEKREISLDHAKFLHLQRRGVMLISSIPGWSTHAEPEFASPCIDWETLF